MSTVWIFRELSNATTSHIHAQPPHAQNVNNVRMKCSAWFGPVTTTPAAGVIGACIGIGASGATAVHCIPSQDR